ncbi:MAG: hypothetical protein A2Y72_02075 [Chloroflexi bacterium RBG_13_53_26]|nr:MAG: hypothetical protein A2Y72_02075 [Chloroflexi bacterium RBG_13_53_26]
MASVGSSGERLVRLSSLALQSLGCLWYVLVRELAAEARGERNRIEALMVQCPKLGQAPGNLRGG